MRPFSRASAPRQAKVAAASVVKGLGPAGSDDAWTVHAKPLLWLVAWAAVLLSIWVNASNAKSPEQLAIGVIFDAFGPVAVWQAARAWQGRTWGRFGVSVLIAGISVVISLKAAAGTGAHGRFGAERQAQHAAQQQETRKAAIAATEAELAKVSHARPTVAIEADIGAILDDPRAGNCEEINGRYTKAECPKVTRYRQELGAAKARDTLAAQLASLRIEADKTPPAAGIEADVELFAKMGVPPDLYRIFDTWFLVLAIEVGKTFAILFVSWVTPRSSPFPTEGPQEGLGGAPDALEASGRTQGPKTKLARPEAAVWLLEAFGAGKPLPAGLERWNDGIVGPCHAYAAVWGVSPATVSRWAKEWAGSGRFRVEVGGRTWIGPAGRQLRRVA